MIGDIFWLIFCLVVCDHIFLDGLFTHAITDRIRGWDGVRSKIVSGNGTDLLVDTRSN